MAHLARVRDEAQRGNPIARQSYAIAMRYIEESPNQIFGFERPEKNAPLQSMSRLAQVTAPEAADIVLKAAPDLNFFQLVTSLANGPEDPSVYAAIHSTLPEGIKRKSFEHGATARSTREKPTEADPTLWSLGHAFAIAFAIQCIGRGEPLQVLCPVVAWELGE